MPNDGRTIVRPATTVLPSRNGGVVLTASGESSDSVRTLLALQSGLSLRERRRIELAVLPNETLPEERAGVSAALAIAIITSSAALVTGGILPPWDAPLFGLLTVAVSMLLQVSLSPTCLDGQGAFGRLLRTIGWRSHAAARHVAARVTALLARPTALRARAVLTTRFAKVSTAARRMGALLMAARHHIAAWAEQAGLAAAFTRLHERWQQRAVARKLRRMRAHVEWNWKRFLEEIESQQRQEKMAAALTRAVEQRKRAEGESR